MITTIRSHRSDRTKIQHFVAWNIVERWGDYLYGSNKHALVSRPPLSNLMNRDWFAETVDLEWLNKVTCFFAGHIPVMDQCAKPEHDYCANCQILTPDGAVRERRNHNEYLSKYLREKAEKSGDPADRDRYQQFVEGRYREFIERYGA